MRGAMVLSILGLMVLILVTPSLLGRPASELSSVPLLVIGMAPNETFIVQLGWAIQAYQYPSIRLSINASNPSSNGTYTEQYAYGLSRWVPGNVTFLVHVYFVDQQRNYFEYNVTAHRDKDASNRTVMVFTFPDEKGNRAPEVRDPSKEDFRQTIPRRGKIP